MSKFDVMRLIRDMQASPPSCCGGGPHCWANSISAIMCSLSFSSCPSFLPCMASTPARGSGQDILGLPPPGALTYLIEYCGSQLCHSLTLLNIVEVSCATHSPYWILWKSAVPLTHLIEYCGSQLCHSLYLIGYCILYTVYCILYTVYCVLYTGYCILYTGYWILDTGYCILYTVYWILE